MNPQSLAEAEEILLYIDEHLRESTKNTDQSLIICPPFIFIEDVARVMDQSELSKKVELGAQDIALSDDKALTGEVSGQMLKKFGVKYIIIGHSERRWKIGESDEVVNQKLKMALADGFVPVVCVGEKEHNGNYKEFIRNQIQNTFEGVSPDEIKRCLIAYEPVWAISSNPNVQAEKPEDTLETVTLIKEILGSETRVLYGGSVNSGNSKKFLSLDEVSGVLVGGASVRKEEFMEILKS